VAWFISWAQPRPVYVFICRFDCVLCSAYPLQSTWIAKWVLCIASLGQCNFNEPSLAPGGATSMVLCIFA
jgi:hypothetical protein